MKTRTQGYHCEGDERIHHLSAGSTRELRRALRQLGLRFGRWRYAGGAVAFACERHAGTSAEPGAVAHIRDRAGVRVGLVFRHGGTVVGMDRRERAEWQKFCEYVRERIKDPTWLTPPDLDGGAR